MENNFNNGGFTQSDSFTSEQKVNALDTEEMQEYLQLEFPHFYPQQHYYEFIVINNFKKMTEK